MKLRKGVQLPPPPMDSRTRDRIAQRKVYDVDEKSRKKLVSNIDTKSFFLSNLQMAEYQRQVCLTIVNSYKNMDKLKTCSKALNMFHNIEWNHEVVPRRFSLRKLNKTVLNPVSCDGSIFSEILAWMRYDSFYNEKGLKYVFQDPSRPINNNIVVDRSKFSTFFFFIRSMFEAWVNQKLYAIQLIVDSKSDDPSSESVVIGFVKVSIESYSSSPPRRRPGQLRKRKRSYSEFWIDLFEIFYPYRLYGFGKLAVQQVLEQLVPDEQQHHHLKNICLQPLEEAEPFWKKLGFRWSNYKLQEGHFFKPCKRIRYS